MGAGCFPRVADDPGCEMATLCLNYEYMATTNAHQELLTRAVEDVVPRKLAEEKLKNGKPMRLYLGIDPTGAKLHIGHSVPLRKLKAFQDAGHHIIFLIGSFTAMIGDPSGRDKMREPLTLDDTKRNFETYKEQAGKILDFNKVELRFNHEWLEKLGFNDIIKLASNFTVQQMLERDMFQKRIKDGNPISMHEFFYPLMVGYDSVVLDVDCELGGNDQLFNMLAGRTLQTAMGKRDKFVLTTKLIEGTDGRKMSKTYDNCIWLEDSAKDMYGKTMSIKDELILSYMECCTDMPISEIDTARKELAKGANPRDIKMRLARELVTIYHDADSATHAEQEFKNVFAKGDMPEDIPEIKVNEEISIIDGLALHKIVASKSEARRLIEQGAVKIGETTITSLQSTFGEEFAKHSLGNDAVFKIGKRRFVKFKIPKI